MMNNLLLEEGSLVQVENVSLSVATFAKFQPQSPDFLDITNPKAVYSFLCSALLILCGCCYSFPFSLTLLLISLFTLNKLWHFMSISTFQLSGTHTALGQLCVFDCPENEFQIKGPVTYICGMMVHVPRSSFRVTVIVQSWYSSGTDSQEKNVFSCACTLQGEMWIWSYK